MPARRGRQRGDGAFCRLVIGRYGRVVRRLLAGFGSEFGHIEFDIAQPSGEVDLQWLRRGGDLGFGRAQVQQHRRHLRRGVRRHPGRLDGVDDGVVVPHESGALGPADQCVGEGNPLRPRGFRAPPGHHRIECGLGLAVGTVAAEHAAVRRSGQHHVQPGCDVTFGADG